MSGRMPYDVFRNNLAPYFDRKTSSICNRCSKNLYSKVSSRDFSFTNIDSLADLNQDLLKLNLRGCQNITDLEPLSKLKLTHLNLSQCRRIYVESMRHLRDVPLTHLELGNSSTTQNGLVLFPSSEDTFRLEYILRNELIYLGLASSFVSGSLMYRLSQLSLQYLDLSYCSSANGIDIRQFPKSLQYLSLSNCTINNLELLEFFSLKYLDLSHCTIDNLEFLKGLSSLKYLDLSNCKITNCDISCLRDLPLEFLDLSYCGIQDRDMEILKDIPLKYLNLSGCPITDIGLEYLYGKSFIFEMTDNNNITDAAVQTYLGSMAYNLTSWMIPSSRSDPKVNKNELKCKYLSEFGLWKW